ncbi:MAG: hypothetical protein OXO51_17700 [Gemmatimonadota bacterium]|nr:hypothetical protein [Gemmatimonadota bacterium]
MEIKVDRYTKVVLTLIAVGLLANVFKDELSSVSTPLNPRPAMANNIVMGSTITNMGQRFITASPDGKTVYTWFREEDQQWYDRDKVYFIDAAHADD